MILELRRIAGSGDPLGLSFCPSVGDFGVSTSALDQSLDYETCLRSDRVEQRRRGQKEMREDLPVVASLRKSGRESFCSSPMSIRSSCPSAMLVLGSVTITPLGTLN